MSSSLMRAVLAVAFLLLFLVFGGFVYESEHIIYISNSYQTNGDTSARAKIQQITQRVAVDLEEIQRREILENWDSCPRWFKLASTLKRCLQYKFIKANSENFWYDFSPIVEGCGSNLIKHVLGAKYLVNKDDVKAIVLPRREDDVCTSVTVGIGNDISAETRLQNYVPNAKFYGADPIEQSGKIFKTIGDYRQIAVSYKAGVLNASVLVDGKYTWQNVESVTMRTLLEDTFALPYVDYLSLDMEGAEYKILSQLTESYLGSNTTTICQINIELHGPLQKYKMDNFMFSQTIKNFLTTSTYLPVWVPRPLAHHRMFLLNWKSSYCVEKFYSEWC